MRNNYLSIKIVFCLTFVLVLNTLQATAQSYAVSSIPYHIFAADNNVQGTQDDRCSDLIPLGFNFDFSHYLRVR